MWCVDVLLLRLKLKGLATLYHGLASPRLLPLHHLFHPICADLWAVDMLFVVGGQHEISTAAVIQAGYCEPLRPRLEGVPSWAWRAELGMPFARLTACTWASQRRQRTCWDRVQRQRPQGSVYTQPPLLPLPRPQKQCDQLNVPCSIIALPKSIDNDFLLLDKTFGWELIGLLDKTFGRGLIYCRIGSADMR